MKNKMKSKINILKIFKFFLFIYLIIEVNTAYGKPEYAILGTYGVKCQSCHVNMAGGVRSSAGFLARKDISLIKPSWLGIEKPVEFLGSGNSFFDDKVLWGMDMRLESAHFGPPDRSARQFMLMQLNPSLVLTPFKWLQIDGSYNFAYDIEKTDRYPNQENKAFGIEFKPDEKYPTLRLGYIRPEIGVQYDDHTLLKNETINDGMPLPTLPHEYAEWGAELNYESIDWFEASFGVFGSNNLSKILMTNYLGEFVPIVNPNSTSYSLRAVFSPVIIKGLNEFIGGSILFNGGLDKNSKGFFFKDNYFYYASLFLNLGISDKFAIMTEITNSEKQYTQTTLNYLIEGDYEIMEPIIAYARYERGKTRQRKLYDDVYTNVNQYVIGATINVLPFIIFSPEFRIYDREDAPGVQTQWAYQIHIFY